MKKLVLLFAAVFAMTFVSCDQKGAESSASGSDSVENVSSKSGENVSGEETSTSTDENKSENATSEKQEESKSNAEG